MTQLLPIIIDKLHGMTDAGQRAAIMQQLFGRNYAQLAPLIDAGGAAFTKAGQDADRFGLVLSQNDVNAAHAAEVAHMHLTESVQGIGNMLGAVAMPQITYWTEALANVIARIQTLNPAALQMIVHIIELAAVVATLFGGLSAIREVLLLLTGVLGETGQTAIKGFMSSLGGLLGPLSLVLAVGLLVYEAYNNIAAVHRLLEPYVRSLTAAFNEAASVWNHTHDVASTFKDVMDQLNVPIGITNGLISTATTLVQNWAPIVGTITGLFLLWNTAVLLHNTYLAIKAGLMAAQIGWSITLALVTGQLTIAEYALAGGLGATALGELAVLWPLLLIIAAIAIAILIFTHWHQTVTIVHNIMASLWEHLTGFAAWLGGFFVTTWNNLTTTLTNFFTGIETTALAAWTKFAAHPAYYIGFILAYIPVKLMELESHFIKYLGQIVAHAAQWALDMIDHALVAAIQFVEHLRTQLVALPGKFSTWLEDVATAVALWATNFPQHAIDAALSFVNALKDELNKAPGQMWQIGVDIVQGVINGINSMVSTGVGAITDFIHGLVSGAHDAGQGGSPYMLFANEVGMVGIAQGIAFGIGAGAGIAQNAMAKLVGGLATVSTAGITAAVNPTLGGFGAVGAAAGATGGTAAGAAGSIGPQPDIVLKLDSKELARVVFDVGAERWKLMGGTIGSGA